MSDAASTNLIDTISFTNIYSSLISVEQLVTATAYLLGISFAVKALYSLKTLGESKAHQSGGSGGVKEPLIYMLVAGMFIYFPTGFEVLMNSTFGYSQVLAYAPVTAGSSVMMTLFGASSDFGATLALFIQVIGVIAFVRGWVLVARAASTGQPPGGTGQGLMHVFGGIMAMNIIGTLQVINATLFGV